ncbi:hypothetical protein GGQ96_003543 [Sphingomonas abaci]|uniref:Uncharacterized protein n=1 Tax=Sphingomonas abaci TaxID=237611 RepID=A0A7W7ALT9_9SPHN|nr:hypothetical protein [Sphingomonas abaci]
MIYVEILIGCLAAATVLTPVVMAVTMKKADKPESHLIP